MYVYFISYAHNFGFGFAESRMYSKIESIEQILELTKEFKDSDPRVQWVSILNFQLLRHE